MTVSNDGPALNPPTTAGDLFRSVIDELVATLGRLDETHLAAVTSLAADVGRAWSAQGKLLVCGNGGSAADSQHIVAELVGRFLAERPGYPALALTANTSTLTAVGNDYGFEQIFARQVQALGGVQDVLLVISTSGNSRNCVAAVAAARAHGMKVHGFLGGDGGALLPLLDGALVVPSDSTPKIQEVHITMGHLLCMILENAQAASVR
jgi:D-sedoheptulose 7-phosphate isomerase